MDLESKDALCRFCKKTTEGYICLLYNRPLSASNGSVSKVRECCKATAGFEIEIVSPEPIATAPSISPKEIIKHTLDEYNKVINELVKQHYPRSLAEAVARKKLLSD